MERLIGTYVIAKPESAICNTGFNRHFKGVPLESIVLLLIKMHMKLYSSVPLLQ